MELKQLEFFVTANECGSLGKAAAQLYTTQPNVSKVIRALEHELGEALFERTPHGLRLTDYGRSIYAYAKDTLTNAALIKSCKPPRENKLFCISTYSSNYMTQLLIDLYKQKYITSLEHRNGTAEEIIHHVATGISEIGILYISHRHKKAFLNILSGKNLGFSEITCEKACIYVGPNSPYYNRQTISISELKELYFVRELPDYFSMENGLEEENLDAIHPDLLHSRVCSNSEHLTMNFLLQTDVVELGIRITPPRQSKTEQTIHELIIEGEDTDLVLGYIFQKERLLSSEAYAFVKQLQTFLNP